MDDVGYLTVFGWRKRNGLWFHPRRRGGFPLSRAVAIQVEENRAVAAFEAAHVVAHGAPAVALSTVEEVAPVPVIIMPRGRPGIGLDNAARNARAAVVEPEPCGPPETDYSDALTAKPVAIPLRQAAPSSSAIVVIPSAPAVAEPAPSPPVRKPLPLPPPVAPHRPVEEPLPRPFAKVAPLRIHEPVRPPPAKGTREHAILPMLPGAGERREDCMLYEEHVVAPAKLNVSAHCPADCPDYKAYDRAAWVSYVARSQRG